MRSIRIFAKNMGDPYYEPTTVVHDIKVLCPKRVFQASALLLNLIPYLFQCPYKSLNSSSEIYPVFHW